MNNSELIKAGRYVSFSVTGTSNIKEVGGRLLQEIKIGVSFVVKVNEKESYTSDDVRSISYPGNSIVVKTDKLTYIMEI